MFRRRTLCLAAALMAVPAFGQDADKYLPRPPAREALPATLPAAPQATVADDQVLLQQLKGLRFVASPQAVRPEAEVEGVQVENLPLLQDGTFQKKIEPYIGRPLTGRALNEITAAVVLHYRAAGRPVVDAIVPEQDITAGTVQVVVIEGRVGEVRAEGNKHFRSERLTGQIRLQSGDPIAERKLVEDVDWLNRNPFRRSDLVFERGRQPGETNIILNTTDSFPLRVYTGYEDTGTTATGEGRVFAGFNWGNAFGLDHQLNYQFTASPDVEAFYTNSGSYIVPLPWRHQLSIFGLYSRSRPDVDTNFNLQGESWQVSTRYEIPLPRTARYEHAVTLGTDFKSTNNNLDFGGDEVFDQTAEVAQFSLGYTGTLVDRLGATSGGVTVFYSPGGLSSHNDDEAFEAARAGASAEYVYASMSLERLTHLPGGFNWVARGTAQVSDGPLLGTEQLGFGGAASVRGYDEREGNGDSGFILNNELLTPGFSVAQLVGLGSGRRDALQFLVFADYGIAYTRGGGGVGSDETVFASVGPGVRYQFAPYLTLRYDYGFRLTEGDPANGDRGRGHLSLVFSLTW